MKNFKRISTLLLAVILGLSSQTQVFAQTAKGELMEDNYSDAQSNLERFYMELKNDEMVSNITKDGNTLFYDINNYGQCSISYVEQQNGDREYIIKESDVETTIIISDGKVLVDGKSFTVQRDITLQNINTVQNKSGAQINQSYSWKQLGSTQYYKGVANDRIANLTISVLKVIIMELLPRYVSISLEILEGIINSFRASNSDSKTVYISSKLYQERSQSYIFKDVQSFYKYSDYTGYINTSSKIRIEANR